MYFVDWVGLVECRLGKNKTMVVQYTEYKANSSRNIPNSSDYQIEIEKKLYLFCAWDFKFQISHLVDFDAAHTHPNLFFKIFYYWKHIGSYGD